ncbi:flagellin [Methanococcus maripaludis C5]|uniref:Flagellin n=1 Tax=Methanococcus maripaludis (strain C5 / ATCC BAA-1333) TaxID=402880 RepID=A4G0Q2_METM5|nr:flagellin [Methanococcus maripaludis]ABO36036.1 flagellin [Methanococcus maripaludis C5]
MLKKFIKNKKGAVGIGTLIIFIAMVLVAAIAASVIINTAGKLQHKASTVGDESTEQVASGIQVLKVVGHRNGANTTLLDKLAIMVAPNVGGEIDLSSTLLTISDGEIKSTMVYNSSAYNSTIKSSGTNNIFGAGGWGTGSSYGIIVLQDSDNSTGASEHPTINYGDKVYLTITMNISSTAKVSGEVIPDYGASGIIDFRAPSVFIENVTTLQ